MYWCDQLVIHNNTRIGEAENIQHKEMTKRKDSPIFRVEKVYSLVLFLLHPLFIIIPPSFHFPRNPLPYPYFANANSKTLLVESSQIAVAPTSNDSPSEGGVIVLLP